jgi:hypothetical protein
MSKPRTNLYTFRSDKFPIDPHEDEETNPLCYGKSLAQWLRSEFEKLGYVAPEVFADSWGWTVTLQHAPFYLSIGCGNERDYEQHDGNAPHTPDATTILWHCYVRAESPIWTAFFWRKLVGMAESDSAVARVECELDAILRAEPQIRDLAVTHD